MLNVEETICRLVDNGIAVFVAVMATPRNVDDLFEIAEWSHEHGASQIGISPVIELGRASGNEAELVFSTERELRAFNAQLELIDASFPGFLKKARRPEDAGRVNCGAIVPHATIDYRGFVKICPMDSFPNLGKTLGNVFEKGFKAVFDEHADFVRAFSELDPPNLFDDGCICCENKAFCHSCIARGLMSGMSSESCWWYRNKVPTIVKQDLGLEV